MFGGYHKTLGVEEKSCSRTRENGGKLVEGKLLASSIKTLVYRDGKERGVEGEPEERLHEWIPNPETGG